MDSTARTDPGSGFPEFIYRSFKIIKQNDYIHIAFNFSIEGLCDFSPEIRIDTRGLDIINSCDGDAARGIVFNLGMCEAVSYFKSVLPRRVRVMPYSVDSDSALWWRRLWYNGLGEFFYINRLSVPFEDFAVIESSGEPVPRGGFAVGEKNLIPVGGGKDSCVTAALLEDDRARNLFLTINDQQARSDCIAAAGYGADRTVRVYRTIDGNLLELNKKGFLNGHTPFSAVVAFVSLYCAYLTGAKNIVLSNEASANEGNIHYGEMSVNHQYSKSFEFERDFDSFVKAGITDKISYFSLLRPFSELQIARYFAYDGRFIDAFRSCNRGSKQNIWCGECPKCLFVYGLLSPFVSEERLVNAFGENLLNKESLLSDFRGLTGLLPVKPFECVGTAGEYIYALALLKKQLDAAGKEYPYLLQQLDGVIDLDKPLTESPLSEYNDENLVPPEFLPTVKEMYRIVSTV